MGPTKEMNVGPGTTRADQGDAHAMPDPTIARPRSRPVRHIILLDDPASRSRRLVPTYCGQWVPPWQTVIRSDDATCARCQQEQATYDALEI
jgi:hypothetical protein